MSVEGFDKEKAREKVAKLVEKYNKLAEEGKINKYNEEMTKKDFIRPLFHTLGWDTEDSSEVSAEEKVSRGRVDYAFRIDGIPKMFLEAKPLKADLEKTEYAEQSINYAWHKGSTWAILTDFEGIKVFNAEWKTNNPIHNLVFGLYHHQYLDRFDDLLLLSRESFEKGLLDKEAEARGGKAKKVPVDQQLLSDLTNFRELLTKDILKKNAAKSLTGEELDETVQRILDRLIFIRTLEDRQLEPPMLQSITRSDKNKKFKQLNELYRRIDDVYNSKLFQPHLCEEVIVDDEILETVIKGLYKTSDRTVRYDFGAIDADILGNMYEQYLGHILHKTPKRAKLKEGRAHRKEQGIYYTPTYIVEYIVKNTIGELAKQKKFDIDNIKVLDPACGSGSFLMKAYDYLLSLEKGEDPEEQMKLDISTDGGITYGKKVEILKKNIYGVDLDPKAVEIAQLNLLLKATEKKHRLPMLQENVKVGNSLIEDEEFAGERAFNWEKEFSVFKDEKGFDVIMGNPPYGANLDEVKEYMKREYDTIKGKLNSYRIFIEKSLNLLKDKGYLGFIVPNTWLSDNYSLPLRKKILEETKIHKIVLLPESLDVFEGVTQATTIIILQKNKSEESNMKNKITLISVTGKTKNFDEYESGTVLQRVFYEMDNHSIIPNENLMKTVSKIKEKGERKLQDFFEIRQGEVNLTVYKKYLRDEAVKGSRELIRGNNVQRYELDLDEGEKKGYVLYENLKRDDSDKKRIVIQEVSNMTQDRRLKATLVEKGINVGHTCNYLYPKSEESDLFYFLGLLNSRVLNFYFKVFSNTNHVSGKELKRLPIIYKKSKKTSSMAKELFDTKSKLTKIGNKSTDEKAKLTKKFQDIDAKLDEEFYKIYGLSKKDIKLIEESV